MRYTEEQHIAFCAAVRWTYMGERLPCEMPARHYLGDREGTVRRRPLGYCDVHWDDVAGAIRAEIAAAAEDAWIVEAVLARAEDEYERRRAAARTQRIAQVDEQLLQHGPLFGRNFVYFIQVGTSGPIKIGTSRDPRSRIRDLQIGSPEPLVVLAVRPGGRDLEQSLHARFAEYRMSGEWFRAEPELLAFVSEHRFDADA